MKKILALVLAVMLTLIPSGTALAAEATVTITMTGGELAITVAPDWTVGPVLTNTTYKTTPDDSACTLTNTGNVRIDTTIVGADVTGTPTWTLSNDGSNGVAIYGLKYKKQGGADTVINKTPATFVNDLAASGTQLFGLSLLTPTDQASIVKGNTYTTTVTISAVQG
jgi:hypothetical protein